MGREQANPVSSQLVSHIFKGQALVEKAGAQTDSSYVPGHLGEF